jgi:hypothetical protein
MRVSTYFGKTAKLPAMIFFELDPKKSPISITNRAFLAMKRLLLLSRFTATHRVEELIIGFALT